MQMRFSIQEANSREVRQAADGPIRSVNRPKKAFESERKGSLVHSSQIRMSTKVHQTHTPLP